jgi:serine/threonine-protein kinase
MASVHYGCLVAEGLARTVAIKRLHPQYARDATFVKMMLAEARIASRIRHPNVVAMLDVVRTDAELFLVMEYVHGDTLHHLLQGGPIPQRIAIAIASNVLQGLHAAHEATDEAGAPLTVVHRDVSPQNVMIGADGIARVLDFGIAKAAGSSHTTEQGFVRGKIRYMAPEQITAERSLTRAVDIYAASAVLWEMLAGKPLFDVPEKTQIPFLVATGAVRSLHAVEPRVAEPLADIVMRGLSKDPAERFPTALAMAEALEKEAPAASVMEIGAFVRTCSAERLERRAASVAAMEREALGQAPPSTPIDRTDGNAEVPFTRTEPLPSVKRSRAWIALPFAIALGGTAAFFGLRKHPEPVVTAVSTQDVAPDPPPISPGETAFAPPTTSVTPSASPPRRIPTTKRKPAPPTPTTATAVKSAAPKDGLFDRN